MTSRSQRFIVWSVALLLIVFLYEGHRSRTQTGPAVAFRSLSSAGITIRVRGDVRHPGIYRLPDGATLGTVTNMTAAKTLMFQPTVYNFNSRLQSGMIVDFKNFNLKKCIVTIDYMKAKERMMLAIPLDLRHMDEVDWDALPGIGKNTAHDIIIYRQNNGGFSSLEDLKNVPGISDGKFQKMKSFFYLN